MFGGLLWPIAWILAYSKPVIYKMAYGKDKHDDYYQHLAATDAKDAALLERRTWPACARSWTRWPRAASCPDELQDLRERLAAIEARVVAPAGAGEGAG